MFPPVNAPSCNKVIIPDMILGKLESFAEYEKGNIIDYAKCEQDEAAIFTVIHTLWR
jgi:rRNA-processing protein FCF1